MAKSTGAHTSRKAAPSKPQKPRDSFPLFPHASGKWAKVIRGTTYYFGRWDDPDGAEGEYLEVAEDLHAGRRPSKRVAGQATVDDVCTAFLKSKRQKVEIGELSPRTFVQYRESCKRLVAEFGETRAVSDLGPPDFQQLYNRLAGTYGKSSVGGQLTQVRMVFKYAEEFDLIDRVPKYGPHFKAPGKSVVRREKARIKLENGGRAFSAIQVRRMLKAAAPQLRAMILLGINCGFGNTDCATLPISALDLKNGWVNFGRPKTGIDRRIPLWPETVTALRTVIRSRRKPANPDDDGIVFLTVFRQRWVRYSLDETTHFGKTKIRPKQDDAIAKATTKLLCELGIKRPGLSFYSLRHTFETIAGGSRDQVAVDSIMGHVDPTMAAVYRERIEDDRLRAVVQHVHEWLFPKPLQKKA